MENVGHKTLDEQSMSIDAESVRNLDGNPGMIEDHNDVTEVDIEEENELDNGNVENTDAAQKSIGQEEKQYPLCERCPSQWFTMNSLKRVHSEEQPTTRDAMKGKHHLKWKQVMVKEVNTLKNVKCWEVMSRPQGQKVLHSKYVIKKKRDERGTVRIDKDRFVFCGKEDEENVETRFSPVPDFTVMRLIICVSK